MGMGLLGSLLKGRKRQRRPPRFTTLPARRGRPFLESLETRTQLSILTAGPTLTDSAELARGGLDDTTSLIHLRDPQSDQQPGQNGGPGQSTGTGEGQGDGTNGKKTHPVPIVVDAQMSVQLLPTGNVLGNPLRGPDDQGQPGDGSGNPDTSPGGGPSGQDCSGDKTQETGSNSVPSDNAGDPDAYHSGNSDTTQDSGQTSVPSDSGDSAPPSGAASGTSASPDTHGDTHADKGDPTKNRRNDSQGDDPNAPVDTNQDARPNSTPAAVGLGTADESNAPINGQNPPPDKKQHGAGSGSVAEGEQRGPVSTQDGKQHGPEGMVIPGEELHTLVAVGSQEPEPNTRYPAGAPSPQQNGPVEEVGQRQSEERVPLAEALQRAAIEEDAAYAATDEILTSVVSFRTAPAVLDASYPGAAPQHHGILTDSLVLDFSSLRAEVQSFFEQLNNLGGLPTERRIGVFLSSGAVVVAAAMACEVARRQARRPFAGSAIASVPRLGFASDAAAPSGIGLPKFGQFSALRP